MNNFTSRLLVGAAYVAITLIALLSHQISAAIYIWLIQVFCLFEFYRITQPTLKPLQHGGALFIGSVVFGLVYANQDDVVNLGAYSMLLLPIVMLYFIGSIFKDRDGFISKMAHHAFGWVYISVPLALLLRIGNLVFDEGNTDLLPYYGKQILLVFVLIWANDTFAYLVGRKFGKNKLAPKLSPKKTIEGFIGGIIFSIGFALALYEFMPFIDRIHMIAMAIICSIIGTFGDLFESKIKRSLGIKDSGTALGGHGGFLDRMDSVLMAGPACFFYLFHFTVQ